MEEERELDAEDLNDIVRLREMAARFVIALEDACDFVPGSLSDELHKQVGLLCQHVGHNWQLDHCFWLDHAYCMLCQEGAKPTDYPELKEQWPEQKVSPEGSRYPAWQGWKEPGRRENDERD